MPSGRQRKHQILQRRKRSRGHTKERKKAILLSEEVTKREKPLGWTTNRSLREIEKIHQIYFQEIIERLKKRFPKDEIQILDAGAGNSTFADEIKQRGVRVTCSDTQAFNRPNFHQISTNRLLEHFGKNRFHLIVETWGGSHYGGSLRTALANIYEVLKPGGMASIVALQLPFYDMPLFVKMANEMGITHKVKGEALVIYK